MPIAETAGVLGMQAASEGVSGAMGLLFGKAQRRAQLAQQERLQQIQMKGNKEMSDYQYNQDMKKWEATGYGAQMKQLKEAGLNPGLIYGMGGAGGQSSNASAGAGVTGASAGVPGPISGGEGMGMQMQLLKAQKENIEADTANKRANVPSLEAGTENTKADTVMKQFQAEILKAQSEVQKGTIEEQIKVITGAAGKAYSEMEMAERSNEIQKATKDAQVDKIITESIGAMIENVAKQQKIEVDKAQITKWATELKQGWSAIDQRETQLAIDRFKAEIGASYPTLGQAMGNIITGGLNDLKELVGDKTDNKVNRVNPK